MLSKVDDYQKREACRGRSRANKHGLLNIKAAELLFYRLVAELILH